MNPASPVVLFGIPGLAALVASLFVVGARHAALPDGAEATRRATVRATVGVVVIAGVTGTLAASGLLARIQRPPLFLPMMLAVIVTTIFTARSSLGTNVATRLPLFALVGAQAFRLPLELVMRQAAEDGTMPVVMSFEGRNFDVLTGVTALVLGVVLYFRPVSRLVVALWNAVGFALLVNVVSVAFAAAPWIAAFGPTEVNEWILHFPFVYLPSILVAAALFGHIVVARRLLAERCQESARASALVAH